MILESLENEVNSRILVDSYIMIHPLNVYRLTQWPIVNNGC